MLGNEALSKGSNKKKKKTKKETAALPLARLLRHPKQSINYLCVVGIYFKSAARIHTMELPIE